jgi:hypothetical protein
VAAETGADPFTLISGTNSRLLRRKAVMIVASGRKPTQTAHSGSACSQKGFAGPGLRGPQRRLDAALNEQGSAGGFVADRLAGGDPIEGKRHRSKRQDDARLDRAFGTRLAIEATNLNCKAHGLARGHGLREQENGKGGGNNGPTEPALLARRHDRGEKAKGDRRYQQQRAQKLCAKPPLRQQP